MDRGTAARAARNERYVHLQKSMPGSFKTKRMTMLSNEMLSYAIDEAIRKHDIEERDELKSHLVDHLKTKMDQPRYAGWFWSFLLWWFIPKFVEWFLSKWIDGDVKTKGVAV